MTPRLLPIDPSIGERIRTRRQLRRWSIRHAASRAGIAHTTWSRIEKGEIRTDRYMIADIAAALECPVADLTGRPYVPGDRQLELAHAHVPHVWRTLIEIAPDEPPSRPPSPIANLDNRTRLVHERYNACDYAGAGQLLPDLLADLHATAAGPDGKAALLLLVRATYAAMFTLRNLNYAAECVLAGERCRQAAERLEAPVPLAVADWVRSQAAIAGGSFRRSQTLNARAIDQLDRHIEEETAPEVLGMLHLGSALSVLADRRVDDALAHLSEAERLATRTGETESWSMYFGPTNVGIWRVGIEVDAGDPGRGVETAMGVTPGRINPAHRQSAFHLDLARALSDAYRGRRDQEAVRALLTAERIAPQRIRSSVSARETARHLLDRARRAAGGSELRGLCERMGVDN